MEETEENTSAGLDELPPAYITVSAGVPMVRSRDELGVKQVWSWSWLTESKLEN